MFYKLELSNDAKKDLDKISKYLESYGYNWNKIIRKIDKDIENLIFMPRAHKTLISSSDVNGEYRRMISGNYSIIYKIVEDKIIILRIFNQKENYLNQRKFILREDNQRYFIDKRRKNMLKFRTLKNSYSKLKEKFTRPNTEEKYLYDILEEAVEKLNSGRAVFYTHEEFWRLVREKEEEDYRKEVSDNIRRRYA